MCICICTPIPCTTSRYQVALASKPLDRVPLATKLLAPAPSDWRGDRATAYSSRLSAPLAPEQWQGIPEDAPTPVSGVSADGDIF